MQLLFFLVVPAPICSTLEWGEFDKNCSTEACKVDIDIPSELFRTTIEIKYTRNPRTESNQTMLFFNERGELEFFVSFMDDDMQRTRIGRALVIHYQTRNIADENKVTGETALIALNITKQLVCMTINGMI
ncbi:hypothetical protein ACHWQZ_G000327 [Mnemiopsis leidyi]